MIRKPCPRCGRMMRWNIGKISRPERHNAHGKPCVAVPTLAREATIVLNGNLILVSPLLMHYDDIIDLSGIQVRRVSPTVTYRNAAQRQSEGTLSMGESVRVQNGTVFNVSDTSNA